MGSWETFLIDTRTDWSASTIEGTAKLAEFASSLSIGDVPTHVVERAVDLYVDWAGSAFSGARHRAIVAIDDFAKEMGPDQEIGSTYLRPHDVTIFCRFCECRRFACFRTGRCP